MSSTRKSKVGSDDESRTVQSPEEGASEAGGPDKTSDSAADGQEQYEVVADDQQDEEDEDTEDSDEGDESDLEVLIALAELDAEAAQAYLIAAASVDDEMVRQKLQEFAGDHVRHVEAINKVLSEAGGDEVSTSLDEGSSALTMLAASVGALGLRAALLAMVGNEQLTNSTYQIALDLPFEEDILEMMRRHFADEQRHIGWLTQQEARVRESGAEVGIDV